LEAQLDRISRYIDMIRDETNIDRQIRLLEALNVLLPKEKQLLIPSLITNDYVSKAVNKIEEIWFERQEQLQRQKQQLQRLSSAVTE
jgi:guanylate kinase